MARDKGGVLKALQELLPDNQDMKKLAIDERAIQKLFPKVQGFDAAETATLEAQRQADIAAYRAEQEKAISAEAAKQTQLRKLATDSATQVTKAEQEAAQIATYNADLAAKYYDTRTQQILELAALEKSLITAKTDAEATNIKARMQLVMQAQKAEQALFQETALQQGQQDAQGYLSHMTSMRTKLAEELKKIDTAQSQTAADQEMIRIKHAQERLALETKIADLQQKAADSSLSARDKQKTALDLQAALLEQQQALAEDAHAATQAQQDTVKRSALANSIHQIDGVLAQLRTSGTSLVGNLQSILSSAFAGATTANVSMMQALQKIVAQQQTHAAPEYHVHLQTLQTQTSLLREFGILEAMHT